MSKPHLKLLDAAWCHFQSKLLEAEANLELYLTKTEVVIPDHSSALKEIIHWTNEVSSAKTSLEVLKSKWKDHETWASNPPWRPAGPDAKISREDISPRWP